MRTILVLSLLVLPAFAGASHLSWCTPSTSDPEIAEAGYYVDFDWGQDMWTFWIYEESNGQPGLQRRDDWVDDTCGHYELGDTIIF